MHYSKHRSIPIRKRVSCTMWLDNRPRRSQNKRHNLAADMLLHLHGERFLAKEKGYIYNVNKTDAKTTHMKTVCKTIFFSPFVNI